MRYCMNKRRHCTFLITVLAFSSPVMGQSGDTSLSSLLKEAGTYVASGDCVTALPILSRTLARHPDSAAAYTLLGACQSHEGQAGMALKSFDTAIRINPQFAPAYVNLGNALLVQKKENLALQAYLTAIQLRPTDAIALYNSGLIYGRQKQFLLAETYLERAYVQAPKSSEILIALVEAQLRVGNADKARAEIEPTLENMDARTRSSLSSALLENGDIALAVRVAKGTSSSAKGLFDLGYERAYSEFQEQKYSEAKELLTALRQLVPLTAEYHELLGSVSYALDDAKSASDEFQAAIQLNPINPDLYSKLGMVFLKHRTPEPAIYIFKQAIAQNNKNARLWLGLGLSYYFASKYDPAIQAFERAIALDPSDVSPYISLGDLYFQTNRPDLALDDIRKAISVQPNTYIPYYYFGKIAAERSVGTPGLRDRNVAKIDPTQSRLCGFAF